MKKFISIKRRYRYAVIRINYKKHKPTNIGEDIEQQELNPLADVGM